MVRVLLTASVFISTRLRQQSQCEHALYLKHFDDFTNPSKKRIKAWLKSHSLLGKRKRRLLNKLHNTFCVGYIVVIRNGDNRRFRWTKSNFSKVLFRLQREQAPWQNLGTETNSGYSNVSRLQAWGQQTQSVFIVTAGRTIITVQNLNRASLEAC